MLKNEVDRSRGKFTRIPNYVRRQVNRTACEVCHREYGRAYTVEQGKIRYPKQILEHLIPRRWLHEHGIYSHHPLGMISACQYCHAPKAKLEDRLYQGDVLSYLQGLKKLNYPVSKVIHFALSVGLKEFGGLSI
jgi:hypothetical protein